MTPLAAETRRILLQRLSGDEARRTVGELSTVWQVESFLQWIRWKREEAEQRHDLEMVVAADGLETLAMRKLAAVLGVREIGSD
jgi:hypothetical protein